MVIDHELRDAQPPHRLGECAEPRHIADVHDHQRVDAAER
jgi:hypothetical protein